jgi:hypothetical protein
MRSDLFAAVLDWWHRVSVPQLAREHDARGRLDESDQADEPAFRGCLPVGASEETNEIDVSPCIGFDDRPPDC